MIGNDCSSDIAVANACGMDSLFIHANISPPLPKEIPATYAIIDGDFRKVASLILK
jgi:ribonucleotide monophosphatase NagD (HAD superfamily)